MYVCKLNVLYACTYYVPHVPKKCVLKKNKIIYMLQVLRVTNTFLKILPMYIHVCEASCTYTYMYTNTNTCTIPT